MSTHLALQHDEWHRIHGKYQSCPLDCSVADAVADFFEDDARTLEAAGVRGIICGACKGRHLTVNAVRFCYEVKRDAETFARREAAMAAEIEAMGLCEHELSAALCAGPGHYPADRWGD